MNPPNTQPSSTTARKTIAAACLCAAVLMADSGCARLAARRAAKRTPPPVPAEETVTRTPAKPAVVDPVAESRASVDRANKLKEQGLLDIAIKEFEKAIVSNPKMTTAYLGIADIHKERGDTAKAQVQYQKAAELEPGNFDAQYNNGLTLQQLGRFADSIRAYVNAVWLRPDSFDANLNLATAYLQYGEPAAGLPYAKRAVQLKGNNGPARFNLGAIYAATDHDEDAIVEYQQAAELMELSPELLLNWGESLGKVGRFAEMQNTLEQLVKVRPSAVAHERLGTCFFRQAKYDESLTNFRKATDLDAKYFPAWNGVGVCLLNKWLLSDKQDMDSKYEAISALRHSLQLERKQPVVIDLINTYGP